MRDDAALKGHFDMVSTTTETTVSAHPLDPLSAAEIARAWEIVRTEHALGPRVRVIFVMLHEPAKKVVLQHRPGDAVERAAFVVLVDSATRARPTRRWCRCLRGPRAVVDARARRAAGHRARRVRRVRGGGARRPALAGGHAPARGHRLEPGHGRPWSAGNFGIRGRRPAPRPRAHLGAARPDGQRLRSSGRQPASPSST